MQTHRAYLGADTAITAWVRDDAGKRDMTGETLTVHLYPYGRSTELSEGAAIAATSAEDGKITFTVTEAYADSYLRTGAYRMQVKAGGTAVVYDALLEVV